MLTTQYPALHVTILLCTITTYLKRYVPTEIAVDPAGGKKIEGFGHADILLTAVRGILIQPHLANCLGTLEGMV